MSSKHLDQWGHTGTGEGNVGVWMWIEEKEWVWLCACERVGVCMCVCGCLLTCKLVLISVESWVLRTQRGPPPSNRTPSGFLQATKEFPQRPSSSCRTLCFIPETQRKQASSGFTATCTPNNPPPPQLFYLTFYYYCWWRDYHSLDSEGGSCPQTLISDHFPPFSPRWLRFGIVNLTPPSVRVGDAFPEL